MEQHKIRLLGLLVAFLLGSFLRFYQLGQIPIGLHRDEAFLGYNAYSLLKTGRDMTGEFMPLHFRSFLYSPGGYSYLSIPFLAAYGLTPYSVRLAAAVFGAFSVVMLALMLFLFAHIPHRKTVGLISAFLLALSPWHINLSRTATEHIPVLFFILLGIWLYMKSVAAKRPLLLLLSFVSFSVTLTLYQAPRLFLPLFIPVLLWNYSQGRKLLAAPWILFVLCIVLPVAIIMNLPNLGLRIQTVSVFATKETQLILDEAIREDGVMRIKPVISRVFHNKVIGYTQAVTRNYFDHFSYNFLFTDAGFPDRYRVPGAGLLYGIELPLLLTGLITLLKRRSPDANLLVGWMLLAPVGSALTFDDIPNLQRTVIMVVPLIVLSAIGIVSIWENVWHKSTLKTIVILAGICLFYAYNVSSYLHAYVIHQVVHKPWQRMEGYREMIRIVDAKLPEYTSAIITNRESAPAIFVLFFLRYDPVTFQQETAHITTNDFDRVSFGKYIFTTEDCPLRYEKIPGTEKTILIGKPHVLYVNAGTCPLINTPAVVYDSTIKRGDNSEVFQVLYARETKKP